MLQFVSRFVASHLFQTLSHDGDEEVIVFVCVADVQPIVVRHLIAEHVALFRLFAKERFQDGVLRWVTHLRQNCLPVLQETSQIVVAQSDFQQILELEQTSVGFADFVVLMNRETYLSSGE